MPDNFAEIEPLLLRPETFRHWSNDVLRFSDTDLMGHINNAAYARYCETGRVAFNHVLFGAEPATNQRIVLARIAINYRRETHYPGDIRIGSALSRIGTTSMTIVQGLFVGDAAVATSEAVIVHIDPQTRRPTPITDSVRAAAESWLVRCP